MRPIRAILTSLLLCTAVTIATAVAATHAARAAAPGDGPGGPVLIVTDPGDPYGRYYGEILRAEGLNAFAITTLGALTPQALAAHPVVLLAQSNVSADQAAMLTAWVQGGGNLVAMRPAASLDGLLGLGPNSGALDQGYLAVDTATAPGAGITGATMQFHGRADRHAAAGASTVATLYSDAATPTASPAVTRHAIGSAGGEAAAFTYDLARSVVETRQGNPAFAGQNLDGQAGPFRSDNLFFGGWLDFSKVAIPQADEQQRLLANLITTMARDRVPLPRFWYLPRGAKAAVVMTGDDHAGGGTAGRFDAFAAASPSGCSVAAWQCVRGTSYVYPNTPISDAQVAAYQRQGFEIALHLSTNCENFTPASLDAGWAAQLAALHTSWPSIVAPRTNRTHCIAWSDWVGEAQAELAHGVRFDTNYYYWPAAWVADRPGMFTGSGFPMRFAATDGSLIDVYQAATQLTDESGMNIPRHIAALLDGAVGAAGYYGVFTANMHTDVAAHADADAIVAAARDRGVPVVSSAQMLDWTDARNDSSFDGVTFAGNELRFTLRPGAGADGLQAMLPVSGPTGRLTALTRAGGAVATTTRVVKGIEYAVFDAAAGGYSAAYAGGPVPGGQVTPTATALALGGQAAGGVRPGAGKSGAAAGARDVRAAGIAAGVRRVRMSRRGTVAIPVTCPAGEGDQRCAVDLRLARGAKRFAHRSATVRAGRTAGVTLKLPRALRGLLARRRALPVTVVLVANDAAGTRRTTTVRLTLLAAKRPR
jgi:hypothetical protein